MSRVSKSGKVRLHTTSVLYKGKISTVPISIVYFSKNKPPLHVDITCFRPDPCDILKTGKEYNANLEFDSFIFPSRDEVEILRTIKLEKGAKIVNIR